jgi:hypothetical protein
LSSFDGLSLDWLASHSEGNLNFDQTHYLSRGIVWDGPEEESKVYFEFPWYFPASKFVRNNIYIPAPPPPIPSDLQINVHVRSLPFDSSAHTATDIVKRWEENGSGGGGVGVGGEHLRVIELALTGPTQMTLVIEHKGTSCGAGCVVAVGYENWSEFGKSGRQIEYKPPPPEREEGCYYIQLRAGSCGGWRNHSEGNNNNYNYGNTDTAGLESMPCNHRVLLLLSGDSKLRVAAQAHHVNLGNSPQLVALREKLPSWARGAEWVNMVSGTVIMDV